MMATTSTYPANRATQRVGRKAIACGRTLNLLEAKTAKRSKKPLYQFHRWHLIIPAVLLIIVLAGFGLRAFSDAQHTAQLKSQAAAQHAKEAAVASKAEACRVAKMKEKAAQIGKLTYDQLYDNGACNF